MFSPFLRITQGQETSADEKKSGMGLLGRFKLTIIGSVVAIDAFHTININSIATSFILMNSIRPISLWMLTTKVIDGLARSTHIQIFGTSKIEVRNGDWRITSFRMKRGEILKLINEAVSYRLS